MKFVTCMLWFFSVTFRKVGTHAHKLADHGAWPISVCVNWILTEALRDLAAVYICNLVANNTPICHLDSNLTRQLHTILWKQTGEIIQSYGVLAPPTDHWIPCVLAAVQLLSSVWLFQTSCTVDGEAPLSRGFPCVLRWLGKKWQMLIWSVWHPLPSEQVRLLSYILVTSFYHSSYPPQLYSASYSSHSVKSSSLGVQQKWVPILTQLLNFCIT